MARYGETNYVIYHCPMFGCDGENEVARTKRSADVVCEVCHTPWWPLELGFTGNDPKEVTEFARTHNEDGSFKGDPKDDVMIRNEIMRYLGLLRRESRLPEIREKLDRLASLNVRIGELAALEEVERQFLGLTLPHTRRRCEIRDLLKLLPPKSGRSE